MASSLAQNNGGVNGSPWRTRGAYNPSGPNNVGNLPIQSDCTIGTSTAIIPNDSFIVTDAYTYTGLAGGLQVVAAGDRLVYVGGALTAAGSWLAVYESWKYPAATVIIATIDEAFLP